jgi:transcriptional regulator GlxA family with amidase domain
VILAEAEDQLASLLVDAWVGDEGSVCPLTGRGAWLMRAEEYLAAHVATPVSLANLSEVAGVSTRTLSRGFRERHGVGAMAFLKQRRLDAAHRALRSADPEAESVTAVAIRCGLTHLSRFAGDYRARFGEAPSTTLKRRG